MHYATPEKITETLEKNYMPYTMSVIRSRAIPEIDGFKPAHRKLLFMMYKRGLLRGKRTKSATIVGETMKLNPHGDAAIYETMVRLTEGNEALLHPFVDSKGNFGKQYSRDMAYAASRYTEAKLAPICEEIFRDIEKNTVDFIDNYDGTLQEPVLLPTAFPNILVSPNMGIAVGMGSKICSFNLKEVCDATIAYLKDNKADLREYILGPDFSTGGQLIENPEAWAQVYETGLGSLKVRGKYVYEKKSNTIEITEIPYTTAVEVIIEKIAELMKSGKIREINDVRDETDLGGLRLTIDLKRGTDPDKLMAKLYDKTTLEDSFGCNFNILIDGEPRVMGIKEILKEWTDFRTESIRRMCIFDAENKEARLHLLRGLEKILLDIDKAIRIVRNTPDDSMVVPNLMEGFDIDKIQAEFVAEIKLRNLNKDYILKRTAEIESLVGDIAELRRTAESDKLIHRVIINQLKEIAKKYGKPRKTEIIAAHEVTVAPVEEEKVEDYRVKVFMTKENYFKKIPLTALRNGGTQKLKEGDAVICEAETGNAQDILFFSDQRNCYKMRLSAFGDSKLSVMGDYLPNILGMEEGERIVFATPAYDYKGFMLFAFDSGKVAKIDMNSYATKTNRKRLTGAYGSGNLIGCLYIPEERDVALISTIDKCVVFNTANILTKTSRTAQGVQILTLRRKSLLKAMFLPEDALKTPDSYRAKSLPSSGYYLKGEDGASEQLTLV
ncbi:MAG: topoisomerase IV [Oscillospiraceae bacterium]|nr:topoisomerase IV [Oscillospiraceae bacterium]